MTNRFMFLVVTRKVEVKFGSQVAFALLKVEGLILDPKLRKG